jgi:hypothetical protein
MAGTLFDKMVVAGARRQNARHAHRVLRQPYVTAYTQLRWD